MSDDEKAKKSSTFVEASTDPDPVPVIGGTGTLPVSVFGKERERKDTEGEKMAMKTEFVKMEDKEPESRSIGDVLMNLKRRMSDDEKAKKSFNMDSQDLGHMNSTNLLSQDPQLDPNYGG
ncbi:uncharacterized protein LOC109008620 isoform X1 [Juglans regia]|uniref:Uncharacterized protein LOC109008620 isoform X1 n=1 Tax=Juglans regia TaxID=51240 RepID=A0A6P9EZV0_JUGRE|nr:uncharacterized protein LOC109008620 isoform X1 [Juglans regia]